MASTMVVPPSKHTLFMRGFTARQNIDKIREFFIRESGGCTVEFFKESENRERLFVALRFETKEIAKDILNRYDNGDVLGDRITISWFKDLRRARQKAAQQGLTYPRGWVEEPRRQNTREVSPLRNGFRPGQYKNSYGRYEQHTTQSGGWHRQNSGGTGHSSRSQRRYNHSSSRSRSRSGSSSHTYSRSRSRSHSQSRERERSHGRSKSRDRSYSRSRDRSKSQDSRNHSPASDKHSIKERENSPENNDQERSERRWDTSKSDGFKDDQNGNDHYDRNSREQDSNYDRNSPPRSRHIRSEVKTVREDSYEREDDYGSDTTPRIYTASQRTVQGSSSVPQPVPPPAPLNTSIGAIHEQDFGVSREDGRERTHKSRSRSRDHDPRDRLARDHQQYQPLGANMASTKERRSLSPTDCANQGHSVTDYHKSNRRGRSRSRSRSASTSSDRSARDQDRHTRKNGRKRSVSGDERGGYGDVENEPKKGRYAEEKRAEKVIKRPMAKRTRGAETLDDTEERDQTDRGALGLPQEKMLMVREKKEEIEKAYRQDCETFAAVVKMLVSKDSGLESKLQQSLRENLKEIGQRCIQELREFIDKVKTEDHL